MLAVRGGGHSLPGLSTRDDGIVLGLSRLRDVAVDPQLRRATVGGGALLGDPDRAAVLRRIGGNAEPDLLWAIRGGGGKFGVVTRFELQARPLGAVQPAA
ncbi:MAG: FAD-binding protein [Dongiaceae bacterium]